MSRQKTVQQFHYKSQKCKIIILKKNKKNFSDRQPHTSHSIYSSHSCETVSNLNCCSCRVQVCHAHEMSCALYSIETDRQPPQFKTVFPPTFNSSVNCERVVK